MDVSQVYALSTSLYLALQALPVLAAPNLLIFLCTATPRPITDLETYLARALALALLALSAQVLVHSGIIPLGDRASVLSKPSVHFINDDISDDMHTSATRPYTRAMLFVTTAYHASGAVHLYAQIVAGSAAGSWNLGFSAGMVVSGGLFCFGLWNLLFGGERMRISSRTGADKRTSSYPFENKESAREKRKEEREKEKEREREREKEKDAKSKRRSALRSLSSR